jgi:flagellar biosynthetic protein FliQ
MTGLEVIDVTKEALLVTLKVASPLLIAALVVGVSVAFLQAITQIQEFTLTFIPKILVMFLLLFLLAPLFGDIFTVFSQYLADKIVHSGATPPLSHGHI